MNWLSVHVSFAEDCNVGIEIETPTIHMNYLLLLRRLLAYWLNMGIGKGVYIQVRVYVLSVRVQRLRVDRGLHLQNDSLL